VPSLDDGQVGRKTLSPGESILFSYRGRDYLAGRSLPPGIYQVMFDYENTSSEYGDWIGKIESEWITFEVAAFEEGDGPEEV